MNLAVSFSAMFLIVVVVSLLRDTERLKDVAIQRFMLIASPICVVLALVGLGAGVRAAQDYDGNMLILVAWLAIVIHFIAALLFTRSIYVGARWVRSHRIKH